MSDMSSRKIFSTAVLVLLTVILFIARYTDPEQVRSQQHLTYNTELEDTNLAIDPEHFSSKLPVVSIDTHGQEIPGRPTKGERVEDIENIFVQGNVRIYDREGQLHTLGDNADLEKNIEIRVRGNSSRHYEKSGYLLRLLDRQGNNENAPIMGMEENNTWVLHGPYLDKTLIRNYMWYNLSGKIMDWAPDVRFCEVFINNIYNGVYVMTEHIDIGNGRIDITKYDGKAPVSSYILRVDRKSANSTTDLNNFTNYTHRLLSSEIEVRYPTERLLTPEIIDYINKDFSRFEKALYSYDYDTQRYGYQNFIDVDNFVDYVLINEVTMNLDAGRFSTYIYKDVSGKLKLAVWDFNNSCDNYGELQTAPEGFFMSAKAWYFMLFKDEDFTEQVIERYRALRDDIFSDGEIITYIRDVREYLGSAVDRNFEVWGFSFDPEHDRMIQPERKISSYDEAIDQYESWLLERLSWLDENIDALRYCGHESINKKYNH